MCAIDGLDECESRDHIMLISELSEIGAFVNVKLLLCSRPWPAFAQRFGREPHLRMEEFNYDDIYDYASKQLMGAESSQKVGHMPQHHFLIPGAGQLVGEIARRSEGVFLWTALILEDLIIEIRKGEPAHAFPGLVSGYPESLTQYFRERIYGRVPRSRKNTIDTSNALKLLIMIKKYGLSYYTQGSLVTFSLLCQGHLLQPFRAFSPSKYTRDQAALQANRATSFLRETCGGPRHCYVHARKSGGGG